jgi:hypothetical protein
MTGKEMELTLTTERTWWAGERSWKEGHFGLAKGPR